MKEYDVLRIDSLSEFEQQMDARERDSKADSKTEAGAQLVILTAHEGVALAASEQGICAIGIQAIESSSFFHGAFACVTDAEACSEAFLDLQMAHFRHDPYVIWSDSEYTVRESIESDFDEIRQIAEAENPKILWAADAVETMTDEECFQAYISTAYRFYGFGMWTLLKGGRVAGWIGFAPGEADEEGGTSLEAGYILARAYRGKGVTEYVMKHLISYAAEEVGIDRIYIHVDPENAVSAHIAEKLGFVREGEPDSEGCISFVLHV